jgi:hypothetical protein
LPLTRAACLYSFCCLSSLPTSLPLLTHPAAAFPSSLASPLGPHSPQARPLEDGLSEAIDEGKIGPRDDPKVRSKILSEEFGWDKEIAKKIWCFGPDTTGELS